MEEVRHGCAWKRCGTKNLPQLSVLWLLTSFSHACILTVQEAKMYFWIVLIFSFDLFRHFSIQCFEHCAPKLYHIFHSFSQLWKGEPSTLHVSAAHKEESRFSRVLVHISCLHVSRNLFRSELKLWRTQQWRGRGFIFPLTMFILLGWIISQWCYRHIPFEQ